MNSSQRLKDDEHGSSVAGFKEQLKIMSAW